MKVLVVSDAWLPQVNGVVRTYEHLTQELDKIGYETKVIGPADFPLRFPLPGYTEIKLAFLPRRRLGRMIKAYNPDHLHIATEGPLGWAARGYALKHEIPFTTAYHTEFPDYAAKRVPFLKGTVHKIFTALMRRFHRPAKAVMVGTPSLAETLTQRGFEVPKEHMTRGVNLELFSPGPKTLFGDLPGPIALYVGRVAIEKSIHKFLEMEWRGSKVVVGHGPSMDYFTKRYPGAYFAGVKTGAELVAHYRSSDVFVFPSKTDTFGIVLIEALACGLPIAAYDVTGPKDIVTADHLGILHEDLGHAATKALEKGSPDQRRAHVQEHYSWALMARQFLDAFED